MCAAAYPFDLVAEECWEYQFSPDCSWLDRKVGRPEGGKRGAVERAANPFWLKCEGRTTLWWQWNFWAGS
eukprot:1157460-Pelagomonas_calceolata.AAC.13